MSYAIRYGKADVAFYRTYARPLTGLTPVPESAFTGRDNRLFAASVDVEVFGDNFLPSYTEGDNRLVVATDSMKNFVFAKALEYPGATLEGYLRFLGEQFLETYAQMEWLRLTAHELAFDAPNVPTDHGAGSFGASPVLFGQMRDDHAVVGLELVRADRGVRPRALRCGREGLRLIKLTGSGFAQFVRDEFTTLPEVVDRPLFIYLDVFWTYLDPAAAVADEPTGYVAPEQVRDVVATVFHQFVSMSIQHLVHEMGQRLLQRFPTLASVSFEAQNRLWDTMLADEADPARKVYGDPRPPYGSIGLTLTRQASAPDLSRGPHHEL
jgi:urate oxidase